MKTRREFITLFGGAVAAAWPLGAHSQPTPLPSIGFLNSGSPAAYRPQLAGFHQGLRELGFNEGQNVTIEYRWADGEYERLPELASDLVGRKVAIIVATGGSLVGRIAKAVTQSIPIVFTSGADPIRIGLVASLNRPGGNITGVNLFTSTLAAKRLQLLHELVPKATVIAMIVNPRNPNSQLDIAAVQAGARAIGVQLVVVEASNRSEMDTAFSTMAQQGTQALLVSSDPLFANQASGQMVALAARHAIPAIYDWRDVPAGGGLASYGSNLADGYRLAGIYTGRILKGESPAELPVLQPTKFELVINMKTAKTLGLEVPWLLQQLADDIIE